MYYADVIFVPRSKYRHKNAKMINNQTNRAILLIFTLKKCIIVYRIIMCIMRKVVTIMIVYFCLDTIINLFTDMPYRYATV